MGGAEGVWVGQSVSVGGRGGVGGAKGVRMANGWCGWGRGLLPTIAFFGGWYSCVISPLVGFIITP